MKDLSSAIEEIKKGARDSFDESVEVHINLNTDVTKSDQTLKTSVTLPHGTGKETRIAVLASKKIPGANLELKESDLKKIEAGEIKPKADFDVLIVEPEYMPKLAKLGQILGPAGLMPNPKAGTVTEDVKASVEQYKKGKIDIRNEPIAPIIHTVVGKASFSEKQLIENFEELWSTLLQNKPAKAKADWIKSCYICTSMGKSVQVDINNL